MTALMTDVRSAIRALAAARGFTAIAILTLGTGLTLCVAVLTIVNAYVVKALPYPAADRLYRVDYAAPNQPAPRGLAQLEWDALNDIIEFPIAWDLDVFYLLGHDYPESRPGGWVTPGYMRGLGVAVALGRTFDASDYEPNSPAVALISHRLWHTRFQGEAAIIGRRFQAYVSDRPDEPEAFTIVGVLSPELWHLNPYTEVLAPLKAPTYPYMIRLRKDVAPSLAAERITRLVRSGSPEVPSSFQATVTSVQKSYVASIQPVLWAVSIAAGLVLLIAGANIAVLMLVRGHRRQKELAVRHALGADHIRLVRSLMAEALIVGTASTAIGIVAGATAMTRIAPLVESFLERRVPGGVEAFAPDSRVVLAGGACGLVVTIVFTMVPLVATWRASLTPRLSISERGATDAAGSRRSRGALIGIEVAASLTLLIGAVLMAETAVRMLRVDFGIEAHDVMTASLALRQRSYPDEASRARFYDRLTLRLAGVAGATSVALGDWWPLQGARPRRVDTGGSNPLVRTANIFAVSGEYFGTMGMSMRDGRSFNAHDGLAAEPVVILSESLAQRLWPGDRALGRRLTIQPEGQGSPISALIVGVVNDVRQTHADNDLFDAYVPLAQRASRFAFLYVRRPQSATWESDLRSAVADVDAVVALGAPRSLESGLEQERARPRLLAYLLSVFAVFACAFALVGMYGVIAYAARQRQREIAVRIAIGADARSVTLLFLRHGFVVLLGGILAGLAGAMALGQVLRSQLYGVRSVEPRVLAVAAIAFGLCGLLAIWWPASRAASTDPVLVLKDE